jgi:hypothetical protein
MNALLATALMLAAGDVEVFLKTDRQPARQPAKAIGSDFIETWLTLDNLKLHHKVAVDPKNADEPVSFGYGDFFFGCEFGREGNGGWNLWHFTSASVTDPRNPGKPVGLYRRAEGLHIVERGPRAVADVAWWLAAGPQKQPNDLVTMRLIKLAAEPAWCYIETAVEGETPLALASTWYSAFPGNTSGPPARERWVTAPGRSHNLMTGPVELDPARDWAISLHNKHGDERGGSLLVFDPDEVATARVEGTYGVTIHLTPKPGRKAVRVAISYFLRQHYEQANAAFLRDAPGALERLRKVDWEADLGRLESTWGREMQELAEPLRLAAGDEELALRMDGVRANYGKALAEAKAARAQGKPVPRRLQRQLADSLTQFRSARDALFAAAVKALLNEKK